MNTSRPGSVRPLAALLIAAGVATSCAPTVHNAGPNALRLDSLAARESRRPAATRDVPLPPGMPEALLRPVALGPTAHTPLDDAIRAAANHEIDFPSAPDAPSLSDALRLSAARMYAHARSALLSGDQAAAADLLERVVAIDPAAGEAWSSLASIRTAQGDLPAATEAWRGALAADRANTRALEQLGLAALRRDDLETALGMLARARLNNPASLDAALPYLIDAALADALEQSGAYLAAAQAAERAASAPAPFDVPTNEQRRLIALLRQRALLFRGAGDMRLRLGDTRGAANAYRAALELDETFDAPTVARLIYALCAQGADAAAALALVRELERSGGRVDATHVRLVEHLSEFTSPETARAFAEALPGVPLRGEWEDTPASRSAAARLDAAGQRTPAGAVEVLLAYLVERGPDDAAAEQLARTAADEPRLLSRSLTQLVAAHPLRASSTTALVARAAADRAAFERALIDLAEAKPAHQHTSALTEPQAASLARAWLALRTGDATRALTLFDALADNDALGAHALFGRVHALSALGRLRDAAAASDALARRGDVVSRLLAGAANGEVQRHDEALALLRPLLSADDVPHDARVEALLYAARSAAAIGQMDSAERWLREVVERSPLREDAYAGLLQIGFAGGAQRNQAQLADVVRRLRENIPTSRSLRLLQARELASQGQATAALEILSDLLSLDPRDEAAQEQYVGTLMAAGQASTAEQWLRSRLDEADAEPAAAVLLARVLASTGRAEEAEQILRDSEPRFPRGEALRRERESLLRGPLQQPVAADELALERLANASATLDNTIELAEVHARLARWSDAAASLERALSNAGVSLRRDQRERVARALGFFAAAVDELEEHSARFAADAAGMLLDDAVGAPDALHRARIVLLVRAGAAVSELLGASEAPARSNRDLALQLRLGAIDLLKDHGQPDRALQLARDGSSFAGVLAPEMLAARITLAAEFDRVDDALAAIRESENAGLVAETFRVLNHLFGDPSDATPSPAELAYLAAQLFGAREESAGVMYEAVLARNPNHPWAANNFGYGLIERGEQVLRAYDLIQRAYAQLPSENAIVDSLGWARYRVGILEDTVNSIGEPLEGAITLLKRAAASGSDLGDYVMHEHLGDALWRAGRRVDAVQAWERAAKMAQNAFDQLARQTDPTPPLVEFLATLRASLDGLAQRVAAANAGAVGAPDEPQTPEIFTNLRDEALKIPLPNIRPAQTGAPGA